MVKKSAPKSRAKRKPKANRQVKSYMFATLFNNVEAIISIKSKSTTNIKGGLRPPLKIDFDFIL